MSRTRPAPRTTHRTRPRGLRVSGLLVVVAALAVALSHELPASSSPRPLSWADGLGAELPDHGVPSRPPRPAVDGLDDELREAVRAATVAAAGEGVELRVVSGWRSPQRQAQLLEEAVAKYGSREEAARWVATPETSAHVSGDAVDVGPSAAAAWLGEHGAAHGLCRVYDNEPWHFELRQEAGDRGCPPTYADPTHDPRMHP